MVEERKLNVNFDFEEINKVVMREANRYCRITNVPPKYYNEVLNEVSQELWLKIIETKPENIKLATIIARNKAIDLLNKKKKDNEKVILTDYKKDCADSNVEINIKIRYTESYNNIENKIVIKEMLNKIENPKVKKYIIASGYLRGGLDVFEQEFLELVNALNEEKREAIMTRTKNYFPDYIIAQEFLNLKGGSTCEEYRVIKRETQKLLNELL